MSSFLQDAGRRTVDVKSYLKEVAGGNTLKYKAEKGKKHAIYFPICQMEVTNENGDKEYTQGIYAISGRVHEWTGNDGKFNTAMCTDGIIRRDENTGEYINDGSCPFCERIADGWHIRNYREEYERLNCGKTGPELEKHMEAVKQQFLDERKAKEPKDYIYVLIAKFEIGADGNEVLGQDGLPVYELKVMRLSTARLQAFQETMDNCRAVLHGNEIIISYSNDDDPRLIVSKSTVTPIIAGSKVTDRYPALTERINNDVANFKWAGLEKSFPEWNGISNDRARAVVDSLFRKWDEYQQQLVVNPNARYLEYASATTIGIPTDRTAPAGIPMGTPGIVQPMAQPMGTPMGQPQVVQPQVVQPQVVQPQVVQPQVVTPMAQPQMAPIGQPQMVQPAAQPMTDANALFGGTAQPVKLP